MIHEDQQETRQLCELADFIDSGFQCFHEQVESQLPAKKLNEAAFFAGAALATKLMEHFGRVDTPEEFDFLMGLLASEVNAYMDRNNIKLEWEPHIPSHWQQ